MIVQSLEENDFVLRDLVRNIQINACRPSTFGTTKKFLNWKTTQRSSQW